MSSDQATQILLDNVQGKTLHEPRHFSFTPGRRKNAWNKNCIAVGLASGFLEPLESTSIALVETAIDKIILSFDQPEYDQKKVDRFNDVTQQEYERVRDFIILHYKLNQRVDGELWQYCRDMDIPEPLAEKMHLFKSQGEIIRYPWEIFGADSWLAIFDGLGYLPDNYATQADNMPLDYLQNSLTQMRQHIKQSVGAVPSHVEFLRRFAGYHPATMGNE